MAASEQGAQRRARLARARLYLVCAAWRESRREVAPEQLEDLLLDALAGGVDIVQLREKRLPDEQLVEIARCAHALCARLGALLIVNDRPLVAREAGADGVHVGQEDMPVREVRELVGPDMLIGLSTHAPLQVDAAAATGPDGAPVVDYIGVGPVHETPTKPGRAAVGLQLVRHAAASASVPFFAIGGIDERNIGEVLAAGARGVCVLRAVADADNPQAAARALRARLDAPAGER